MTMKYRTRPKEIEAVRWYGSEEIEAVRWYGSEEGARAIKGWLEPYGFDVEFQHYELFGPQMAIWVRGFGSDRRKWVTPGQWITIHDKQHCAIVNDESFRDAYEEAT